jgi:hypothetical protein
VIVDGSIGSSKVTVTFESTVTFVAPPVGVRAEMPGASVSGALVYPIVTDRSAGDASVEEVVRLASYWT